VYSVVVADRWDEPLDFEDMPAYWADFCWHVIDASRGLVSEQQCAYCLAEDAQVRLSSSRDCASSPLN